MAPPSSKKFKTTKAVSGTRLPVAVGDLFAHELKSQIFGNTRLLRVWLPPEYDGWGEIRYPVLYLNDGQNLFDPATAFAGVHWAVAETAARLIAEKKIPPMIFVGIDNTKNRACEYIPYRSRDPRVLKPMGKLYPEFLQSEVMPFVETKYSILKGPENTGLGGSSLGGLITLYTQLAAPGVFGKLLIESPSLFVANKKILVESSRFRSWPKQIFLGVGTSEVGNPEKDAATVENVRELESVMREEEIDERRLRVRVEQGANHSEASWAHRLPEALEFLWGSQSDPRDMP